MSALNSLLVTPELATGTSAKTLMQIVAPSNHRVLLKHLEVAFQGITATDTPILVELLRQTDAGTTDALTPVKKCSADDETLQVTARQAKTSGHVEPTAGDVIFRTYVHPQTARRAAYTSERAYVIKGGERLGVRVTAGVSVNATVSAEVEE